MYTTFTTLKTPDEGTRINENASGIGAHHPHESILIIVTLYIFSVFDSVSMLYGMIFLIFQYTVLYRRFYVFLKVDQ